MVTIKSHTDFPQSKKLAEILSLKSADYHYISQKEKFYFYSYPLSSDAIKHYDGEIKYIPCWSLAALLGVLPKIHGLKLVLDLEECSFQYSGTDLYITASNPVDACYEMILKLKELNLL